MSPREPRRLRIPVAPEYVEMERRLPPYALKTRVDALKKTCTYCGRSVRPGQRGVIDFGPIIFCDSRCCEASNSRTLYRATPVTPRNQEKERHMPKADWRKDLKAEPLKLTAALLAHSLTHQAVEYANNLDIHADRALFIRAAKHPEFRSHIEVAAKVFVEALAAVEAKLALAKEHSS